MKIYCLDISFNEVNTTNIEKYFHNSKEYKLFFSDSGIYKIYNQVLYKLTPSDSYTNRFMIKHNNKDYQFISDLSKYNILSNISQIPYNHIELVFKDKEYKINYKSLITLTIVYTGNNIFDIYFFTKDNINLSEINDDIITFLSLIKNI